VTLQLILASTREEKQQADRVVVEHHSYVASARTIGRCLKYLIYFEERLVGTFWLGSGFKPTPKAILNYFNLNQQLFDEFFNLVADNKRFCMMESIPNLGTQVLKAIRQRAYGDWKKAYGDRLVAIITTIGDGKKGSVYLADNWKYIGDTAGLPSGRTSTSMKWDTAEQINARFVKPTGENRKRILVTQRLAR
jgi:hypothetical protein